MGVELYAETSLSVDDTTRFELYLTKNGELVGGSRGADQYDSNGMVIMGKRVAACGREATYGMDDRIAGLGLGPLEALPSGWFELDGDCRGLKLHIKTNAVLDVGLLVRDFSLRVYDQDMGMSMDVPLWRPDVKIDWVSRGSFVIDLDSLLS